MDEVPIACDLTELTEEQHLRERELLERFRKTASVLKQEIDAFEFSWPGDPQSLAELGEFLGLERLCCPFLTFELRVSKDAAVLRVSGLPGSGAVLAAEFLA